MTSTIILLINKTPIRFNVSAEVYNKFIDELQATKKVGPMKNLLMRTVHPEDKEALKQFADLPGGPVQIASMLVEAYSPELEITVGE